MKARGFALKVGIGDEFSSLLELRRHYDEAFKAVDIALLLVAKDTAFYFAAFLPFYLMPLVGEEKLHNCHNVYYERLRAYDDKHIRAISRLSITTCSSIATSRPRPRASMSTGIP